MLGEQEKINKFLGFLNHPETAQAYQYLQLEIKNIEKDEVCNKVIRLAKPADLLQIVEAHAQVLLQERGVDRRKVDPESFKQNCLNRILQEKTLVIEEKGKIIFKVELSTDTPEVVYLEGVWVHEKERGLGYGYRCLSQLIKNLLHRTASVCLLLGEKNKAALNLYTKIGFQQRGYYQAVFT
jgi:predicted GNAT family acetyltransferase